MGLWSRVKGKNQYLICACRVGGGCLGMGAGTWTRRRIPVSRARVDAHNDTAQRVLDR